MEAEALIAGLTEERERLVTFLQTLPQDAWERASLCEGWTVRDVVAHLVGNCADTLAGTLADFGTEQFNRRQVDARATATPEDLLAEWADVGPRVEEFLAGFPAEVWDVVVPQIGISTRTGVQRLLEDLWIHAHDIRLPLGAPPTPGPGVEAALDTIAEELPARAAAFAPGAGTIALDLGERRTRIALDGDTTVRISGDPIAFAFAATGRLSLDDAIAEGRLSLDPVPEGFAEALNIYGARVPAS